MDTLTAKFLPVLLFTLLILLTLPDRPAIETPTCDISSPEYHASPTQTPCWNGITPGITTLDEAQALLATRYGENHVIRAQNRLTWTTRFGDDSASGWIFADPQNIVQDITVRFSNSRLSISDWIARAGEPAQIVVTRDESGAFCTGATLIYPAAGVTVTLYPAGNGAGIFAEQSLQTLSLMSVDKTKNQPNTDAVGWQGFIDYCALITRDIPGG